MCQTGSKDLVDLGSHYRFMNMKGSTEIKLVEFNSLKIFVSILSVIPLLVILLFNITLIIY